jgi:hypothetical protein
MEKKNNRPKNGWNGKQVCPGRNTLATLNNSWLGGQTDGIQMGVKLYTILQKNH